MPFLPSLLLAAVLAAPLSLARAQSTDASDHLFQTIQALDTEFFDTYNHCDLAKNVLDGG
jgi:hypothetical protein